MRRFRRRLLHLRSKPKNPARHPLLHPPSSPSNDKQPSDPEILVAGVTFSGFLRMPVSDQDEIAASITERTYGAASPDEVTQEALEVARSGWQDRGYFKVQVNGYSTTLAGTSASRRISLSIYMDEGLQYRLGGIAFKNNRAVSDAEALRTLFPVKDGDTFSREKIKTGLENLSKAYGQWATSTSRLFRRLDLTMERSRYTSM
jgi:outer membrane protein insertion porin family